MAEQSELESPHLYPPQKKVKLEVWNDYGFESREDRDEMLEESVARQNHQFVLTSLGQSSWFVRQTPGEIISVSLKNPLM